MDTNLTNTNCRVCFIDCTTEATNACDIAKLFHDSVGYDINPSDIPQKICTECLDSLFHIEKFKEKCHKAEIFLEKLRNDETTKNDEFMEIVEIPEVICQMKEEEPIEFHEPIVHMPVIPPPEPQPPKLKRVVTNTKNSRVRNWEYSKLEDHLYENHIAHSDAHIFILNYERTRPNPADFLPNEDFEEYERQKDNLVEVACTYCAFRGPLIAVKRHCVENRNTHRHLFRCPCSLQMHCLDAIRNHSAFASKLHTKFRVLFRKLQCNFCQFMCSYETTMEKHCSKFHEEEKLYLEHCGQCGDIFYCEDLKFQHIVFRCNGGDTSLQIPFQSIFGRRMPVVLRQTNPNQGIEENEKEEFSSSSGEETDDHQVCELCGENVLKKKLQRHIERFHELLRYKCDICGRDYSNKMDVARHMRAKHIGDTRPTFPCNLCERVFNTMNSRQYHMKAKHNTEPYPHVCEQCGKRFPKVGDLNSHLTTHSQVFDNPCNMCDAVFKSRRHLRAHQKGVHSNKTFICDICAKGFKCSALLRQHILSHEPNKYFCPVCPQSFSVNHSLRGHVAQKHPEYEMPPPGTILRHADINELKRKSEQM